MNKAICLACSSQFAHISGPCVVSQLARRLMAASPACSALQPATRGAGGGGEREGTVVLGDEMGWKEKISQEGDLKVLW